MNLWAAVGSVGGAVGVISAAVQQATARATSRALRSDDRVAALATRIGQLEVRLGECVTDAELGELVRSHHAAIVRLTAQVSRLAGIVEGGGR